MGFISYNLKFYYDELQKLESCASDEKTIYRAKQLLKMLDDLLDEGYTELNKRIEESYLGVSRLRKYLADNNEQPFKLYHKGLKESEVAYEQENVELKEALKLAAQKAQEIQHTSNDVFLKELINFCKWIGYEKNTAYIFLLRDTMLPYIYYKTNNRDNVYPWLLGRKTLSLLTGKQGVDDEVRSSIIKALECGSCQNFDEFCDVVLPDIRQTIKQYPEMGNCMTGLLKEIKQKRIIVVESGCSGTFPMLLMSLDKRVDVRMYTTYPYLSDIYGDKIYTPKYEENRLFETLYSQDLYFRFCDLKDGCFFVNKCNNTEVEEKSLAEIKTMLG